MYKKPGLCRTIPLLLLLSLLTACSQRESGEGSDGAFSDTTELDFDTREAENSLDTPEAGNRSEDPGAGNNFDMRDTARQAADASNQDILAACAGTTVARTIETFAGGGISVEAQVDVEGVSRVSRYRYLPMQFTEDGRKALLKKWFPAENWDVNEAAVYNAEEERWEFTTPRGRSCVYQLIGSENPEEQILNVEVISEQPDYTGESILFPVRAASEFTDIVEEFLLTEDATGRSPDEIRQIGLIILQACYHAASGGTNDDMDEDVYSCNYMHVCEESGGHRYAKAVFKQMVDGMPVTVWHNFTTVTTKDDLWPVKAWGSLFSTEEIGLDQPILMPEEAAAAMQEQIDSVQTQATQTQATQTQATQIQAAQMQETQMWITKITLEYLSVISSEGTPEIVPVWRFWPGGGEEERSRMCEQILAVNAVSGELIWENRGGFTSF
ncbi:MAG: hypothetical protein NC432_04305 [Roseburia sp.]|nr:hypothetical protein [Roseburia sp.]MCM1097549.1 hypothetical protein [Ruminococcus flavefaciens]